LFEEKNPVTAKVVTAAAATMATAAQIRIQRPCRETVVMVDFLGS
jgi:hypothetical protein